jgi:membrane protease YdiL (CAAX protease family)
VWKLFWKNKDGDESMKGLLLTDEPLSMKKYIFLMALLSLIPSILLAFAVTGLFAQAGPQFEDLDPRVPVLFVFIVIVVFSPVTETLLMSLFFFILSFFIKSRLIQAIVSAILWAVLHSTLSPAWGLVVWWPFFVMSCAYLTWRKKSWIKAVWVTACIHALQNFLPSLAIILGS